MAGFSPAATILEKKKTMGTRLQPTDAQGTHLKQLQLMGLPYVIIMLLLCYYMLLYVIIIIIIIINIIMKCSLKR